MKVFNQTAPFLDKQRFSDGIWYCNIGFGTQDQMYTLMKQEIARVNELPFGNYQKKVFKITEQEPGMFILWRSVYSIQNLERYPKHCEHLAGYPPFTPQLKK